MKPKSSPALRVLARARDALADLNQSENDDGKLLRAIDRVLYGKPSRVIVVIEGGLVVSIFASDPTLDVDMLNRDYSEDPERGAEQEAEDAPLEAELAKLHEIG